MKDLIGMKRDKKRLTTAQSKILKLLKLYGEPAELDELAINSSTVSVVHRLVALHMISRDKKKETYTLTDWGDLSYERGWYYTVPKL